MTLVEAIRARDVAAVRAAIAASGDEAATVGRDERGWTALMVAADEGHAGIAHLLLDAALRAGGKEALRAASTGPDGGEVLALAAARGHRPTFEALARWLPDDGMVRNFPGDVTEIEVGPGFDLGRAESRREAARDRGDGATIDRLVAGAAAGRLDEVAACLARGVPVWGLDRDDRRAIDVAIRGGHAEVVRLLVQAGADPDERTNYGTPLVDAAQAGHPEVIRALVDGGADVRAKFGFFQNALMKAAEAGQLAAARTLIELGADVHARDFRKRSALDRAIEGRDPALMALLETAGATTPEAAGKHLIAAAQHGDVDRARALIAAGAPLTTRDQPINRSALEWAVEEKHPAVVEALLEAGAFALETPEKQGRLVVRAVYWRQPRILRALLDHGASVDGDDRYRTALGQAAEEGDLELARFLLDAGADPNKDAGAGSALTFALGTDNDEMIALLRAAGGQKTYGGQRVEELRGVPSLDCNDIMLLVRGTVEEAARAFAEVRGGAVRWDRDVYGREVAMSPLCYLIYRLRGHSWTVIKELHSEKFYGFVAESDAEELSRLTADRVIYFGISDTAGSYGYDLYEGGERVEHYGTGDGYGYGDPDDEDGVGWGTQFESKLRTLTPEEIGTRDMLNDFLIEQGAYAAPIGGGIFNVFVGRLARIRFEVGGMEAEDFERVDIVHLSPGAYSRRTREVIARHPEPDGPAAPPSVDEDDIPF